MVFGSGAPPDPPVDTIPPLPTAPFPPAPVELIPPLPGVPDPPTPAGLPPPGAAPIRPEHPAAKSDGARNRERHSPDVTMQERLLHLVLRGSNPGVSTPQNRTY